MMLRPSMILALLLALAGCKETVSAPATNANADAAQPQAMQAGSDSVETAMRPESRSQRRGNRSVESLPGTFDFYLLTLSWSPEYCATHTDPVECNSHPAFVLHGLWPENADGTYPEDCSNAAGPTNPSQYSDIYPDQTLLAHEWKTHGTCSGLAANAYFNLERQAFNSVKVPSQLANATTQISLTPNQIVTGFTQANPSIAAGDLVVSCGNNQLTAVEVCLTKSLQPTSCGTLKTCKANTVKITPR